MAVDSYRARAEHVNPCHVFRAFSYDAPLGEQHAPQWHGVLPALNMCVQWGVHRFVGSLHQHVHKMLLKCRIPAGSLHQHHQPVRIFMCQANIHVIVTIGRHAAKARQLSKQLHLREREDTLLNHLLPNELKVALSAHLPAHGNTPAQRLRSHAATFHIC